MKLSEAIEKYLARRMDRVKPKTYETDLATFGPLMRVGASDLSEVTPAFLERFRRDCERSGMQPSTIDRMRRQIVNFLKFAETKDWGIGPEAMGAWQPAPRIYSTSKVDIPETWWPKLLDRADDPRIRAALGIYLATRMPIKEIRELRVGDFDEGTGILFIGGTTTALPAIVHLAITGWLHQYEAVAGIGDGSYLIPSKTPGRARTYIPDQRYERLNVAFRTIFRAAGIRTRQ